MSRLVYVNGKIVPEKAANISVLDHSFMYGNGVFETLRAYGNQVLFLDEHLDRLFRSLDVLNISFDKTRGFLKSAILQTVEKNRFPNSYVRITVSRGVGEPGLDPGLCSSPTVVVFARQFTAYPDKWYETGVTAAVVSFAKPVTGAFGVPVKSCNYLYNFLARREAKTRGALEGIMLSTDGYVTEGSVSNIFIVKNGVLKTAPVAEDVLDGVTRNNVIKLAEQKGIRVLEQRFLKDDLYNADECFLTNTTFEIIPVTRFEKRRVGTGEPGVCTKKLALSFKEFVRFELGNE
ncbi:MAG: branched-chain-amino-acid transaminase [Nitrospinota bacterium]